MYKIDITSRAERELKKLDRSAKNRIITAILGLGAAPRPPGCLRIKSEPGVWRIRVGDYRVGYENDDVKQEVRVIRIGHRGDFYS